MDIERGRLWYSSGSPEVSRTGEIEGVADGAADVADVGAEDGAGDGAFVAEEAASIASIKGAGDGGAGIVGLGKLKLMKPKLRLAEIVSSGIPMKGSKTSSWFLRRRDDDGELL